MASEQRRQQHPYRTLVCSKETHASAVMDPDDPASNADSDWHTDSRPDADAQSVVEWSMKPPG